MDPAKNKKRKEALLEDLLEGDTSEAGAKVREILAKAEELKESGRYMQARQALEELAVYKDQVEQDIWWALVVRAAELHLQTESPERCKELLAEVEHQNVLWGSFKRGLLWAQATADSGNYEAAWELAQALEDDPEDISEQFEKKSLLVRLASEQSFFEAAYSEGMQLVKEAGQTFGVPSREHLRAVNLLSWSASRTGRDLEALALAEGAVAEAAAVLNTADPEFLEAWNNLARFTHRAGNTEKAVELGRELLEARQSLLGEKHHKTLVSADNLATYLEALGEIEEALKLTETTVESWEETLGLEHPKALAPQVRLIALKGKTGQGDEVAERALKILLVHEHQLGAEHVKTLEAAEAAVNCITASDRRDLKGALKEFLGRAEAADAHPETVDALHLRLKD